MNVPVTQIIAQHDEISITGKGEKIAIHPTVFFLKIAIRIKIF